MIVGNRVSRGHGTPSRAFPVLAATRGWGVSRGSRSRKTVPELGRFWLLRIESRPWWRWMISWLIHRPRPVPPVPLVVKKGSKTLARVSGDMPGPVSAMVRMRQGCPVFQSMPSRLRSSRRPPTGGHGVNRVADEIAEHLADFALVADEGTAGALALVDSDMGVAQAALVDGQGACKQLFAAYRRRGGGLFVETQRLVGDGGGTAQFLIGVVEVGTHRGGSSEMRAR